MADNNSSADSNPGSGEGASSASSSGGFQLQAALDYLKSKPTESFLNAIRFAIILFTFFYIIPVTPIPSDSLYQKALLANAALSALRVHQRVPPFQMTREFLSILMLEDSAHYLLYSMIFISNSSITLVLLPIALFAVLHSASFVYAMLNHIGYSGRLRSALSNFVTQYQRQILLTIALTEITLMPTLIFCILSGLASIFSPFMYYQFLTLRYASRRNPYTRQAFHWLRLTFEGFLGNPRCPEFGRTVIRKGIELTCKLAPATIYVPAPGQTQ